jgi:hypothetical protein
MTLEQYRVSLVDTPSGRKKGQVIRIQDGDIKKNFQYYSFYDNGKKEYANSTTLSSESRPATEEEVLTSSFAEQYKKENNMNRERKVGDWVIKRTDKYSFIPEITQVIKVEEDRIWLQEVVRGVSSYLDQEGHNEMFRLATEKEIKKGIKYFVKNHLPILDQEKQEEQPFVPTGHVFNVGDKVTYKDSITLPNGKYAFSGFNKAGFVGTVKDVLGFETRPEAVGGAEGYKIRVTSSESGGTYVMFEHEFEEYDTIINQQSNTQEIPHQASSHRQIVINGRTRRVTVAVVNDSGTLKVGFAIQNPDDTNNPELALKIAKGRAFANKRKLIEVSIKGNMSHDVIAHAIVEQTYSDLEQGVIKIKGGTNK